MTSCSHVASPVNSSLAIFTLTPLWCHPQDAKGDIREVLKFGVWKRISFTRAKFTKLHSNVSKCPCNAFFFSFPQAIPIQIGIYRSLYYVNENSGTVYVHVCIGILSGRTAGRSFYVQFRTVDGDAVGKSSLTAGGLIFSTCLSPTAPDDYTSRTYNFYISDGTSFRCYSIPVVSDSVDEEEECFIVSISISSSRGLTVHPQTATVCINDDDRK